MEFKTYSSRGDPYLFTRVAQTLCSTFIQICPEADAKDKRQSYGNDFLMEISYLAHFPTLV